MSLAGREGVDDVTILAFRAAWTLIEPHLPRGKPGKPRVDDRRVIGG
jgi:hypothetical protein